MEEFEIAVPQKRLDRIAARLADARIGPFPADEDEWALGMSARYLTDLIHYWHTEYDWRAEEAELNAYPQYRATIDGLAVHFQHIRAPGGHPVPIVLTHGWPGSIVEFQAVIPMLVEAGFSVVVPSLPGYGWSGKPANPVGPAYTADLWRKLMVDVLGYPRFYAQGGDWGSMVTSWLAARHSDVVPAIHLNLFRTITPDGTAAGGGDPRLGVYWAKVAKVMATESAYQQLHQTRPQTIGLALHDNPVGWAAWVVEKFQRWSDNRGEIENSFTKRQLITNLMTYLTTDSVMSSIWFYYGNRQESALPLPLQVPTGLASYPGEFLPLPDRDLAALAYNVRHYAVMPSGGHFAAMEAPADFAQNLIEYFSEISSSQAT